MEKERMPVGMATQREKEGLRRLYILEDLAAKKTRIYSKLLTDIDLEQTMKKAAEGHEQRKQSLAAMLEEI